MVDGDSRLRALRRVVLPLAAPGIAATAIFSVIVTYNDFLLALSGTEITWVDSPVSAALPRCQARAVNRISEVCHVYCPPTGDLIGRTVVLSCPALGAFRHPSITALRPFGWFPAS